MREPHPHLTPTYMYEPTHMLFSLLTWQLELEFLHLHHLVVIWKCTYLISETHQVYDIQLVETHHIMLLMISLNLTKVMLEQMWPPSSTG